MRNEWTIKIEKLEKEKAELLEALNNILYANIRTEDIEPIGKNQEHEVGLVITESMLKKIKQAILSAEGKEADYLIPAIELQNFRGIV